MYCAQSGSEFSHDIRKKPGPILNKASCRHRRGLKRLVPTDLPVLFKIFIRHPLLCRPTQFCLADVELLPSRCFGTKLSDAKIQWVPLAKVNAVEDDDDWRDSKRFLANKRS